MSGSRQLLFIVFSSAIHVVVAVLIVFLANSKVEKIYENIEIASYVTPKLKSSAAVAKAEKIKIENVTPSSTAEQKDATQVEAAKETEEKSGEQLANEAEITSPAILLTKTKANRTEAARKADYSGVSTVELTIGSDGLVKKVKLRNSLPYGLDEVALRLAQESKFKPAMIKDKPVASAILLKVRFESEK